MLIEPHYRIDIFGVRLKRSAEAVPLTARFEPLVMVNGTGSMPGG